MSKGAGPEAREAAELQEIDLVTFWDAPDENEAVNHRFYNSEEPPGSFEDPEYVKKAAEDLVSGRNVSSSLLSKRKKACNERKRALKNERYRNNTNCRICDKRTDKRRQGVVVTRCGCPPQGGNTKAAARYHESCLRKKRTSMLFCEVCRKEIMLCKQ